MLPFLEFKPLAKEFRKIVDRNILESMKELSAKPRWVGVDFGEKSKSVSVTISVGKAREIIEDATKDISIKVERAISDTATKYSKIWWLKDGEPCDHPGCLSHATHPCEKCGRILGIKV